jgi:O-antigen/teichoic acid export membrane protein
MLLPRLAGGERTPRTLVAAVAAAGLVWVALATVAVPFVASLVFATTTPPPSWVVALLALSIALGTVGQIAQAQLVAARRPHAAALAWLAGLVVLLVVGLLAAPPVTAATIGQLAAAGLVLGALVSAAIRAGRKP